MVLKQSEVKRILIGLVGLILFSLLLVIYLVLFTDVQCPACEPVLQGEIQVSTVAQHPPSDQHLLCIIVPFRERFQELLEFGPHMKMFLDRQKVPHEIWVIHQVDGYRFNRASLINVGYKESSKHCDYIGMHDVDLLPVNPRLDYTHPGDSAFHLSAPGLHPKYDYETFIGGIFLITRKHFQLVDGMSNKYWGWGLEDDEFFVRLRQSNVKINRPVHIGSGKSSTFKHVHNSRARRRDTGKCYNQRNLTRRRDRQTGLSTLDYVIAGRRELNIDGAKINLIDVQLICDTDLTPWCNCTGAPEDREAVDRSRDQDVVVPILNRKKPKR